jgi:hypothetical protein
MYALNIICEPTTTNVETVQNFEAAPEKLNMIVRLSGHGPRTLIHELHCFSLLQSKLAFPQQHKICMARNCAVGSGLCGFYPELFVFKWGVLATESFLTCG